MLKQLDPDARFEQVCDLEAMKHISKDKTYRPERTHRERAVASEGRQRDDERHRRRLQEQGPVVSVLVQVRDQPRSHEGAGLPFQIGEPIPQEQWETNGLY